MGLHGGGDLRQVDHHEKAVVDEEHVAGREVTVRRLIEGELGVKVDPPCDRRSRSSLPRLPMYC